MKMRLILMLAMLSSAASYARELRCEGITPNDKVRKLSLNEDKKLFITTLETKSGRLLAQVVHNAVSDPMKKDQYTTYIINGPSNAWKITVKFRQNKMTQAIDVRYKEQSRQDRRWVTRNLMGYFPCVVTE